MKETNTQKEFRLAMNDLMSTPYNKKHIFESKNDYKDYPCDCGATSNSKGSTCARYKMQNIKDKFYELLAPQR